MRRDTKKPATGIGKPATGEKKETDYKESKTLSSRKYNKKICSVFPVGSLKIKGFADHEPVTWKRLCKLLTAPPVEITEQQKTRMKYFVRGRLKKGKRRNDKNMKSASLIVADIDDKAVRPEHFKIIHKALKGFKHIIYQSFTFPRLRVVILLREPINRPTAQNYTARFQGWLIDRDLPPCAVESKTFSQPWFFGGKNDDKPRKAKANVEGDFFDFRSLSAPKTQENTANAGKYDGLNGGSTASTAAAAFDGENPLGSAEQEFIAGLKTGTIHGVAKVYAGRLMRLTNLTAKQLYNNTTAFIEAHCTKQRKIDRWKKGEGESYIEEWLNEHREKEEDEEFEDDEIYQAIYGNSDVHLKDVEEETVKWLWNGVFPAKKFSLLAGQSGISKSTFFAWIVAQLTTGRKFEGQNVKRKKRVVLIITAEDDVADTILPRIIANGGNKNMVHVVSEILDFNKPAGIMKLVDRIKKYKADVVLIDPIDGYSGNANTNQTSVVKKICAPLNAIAKLMRVAIFGIMHFKKDTKGIALMHSISGSGGWVSSARCVSVLVPSPSDKELRFIGPVNSNNGPTDFHYRFRVKFPDNDTQRIKITDMEKKKFGMEKLRYILSEEESIKKQKMAVRILWEYAQKKGLNYVPTSVAFALVSNKMGIKPITAKKYLNDVVLHGQQRENGKAFYGYDLSIKPLILGRTIKNKKRA